MKRKEKIKGLFKEKDLNETKHYSKKISVFVLFAWALLLVILMIIGVMFINYEFSDTDSFSMLVKENYLLSVILIIAICAVQVVAALIPGELLEVASGFAFGPWLGALYCLIGILIGSVAVILITRRLGRRFVESLYPREKIDALPILNNPKKLNLLVTLIFFIPGTPKDLLTYAVGLTKMSIPTYILLTSIARFPSIIVSTLGGGALGEDKLIQAAVFLAISVVTGIIGYLIYAIVSKKRKSNNSEDIINK